MRIRIREEPVGKGARMRRWRVAVFVLPALALTASAAPLAVSFEQDVRPLLNRCITCHGPSKARSGLRLDSREAATVAVDSGKRAVVPGQPDQSEILRRVTSTEEGT